jgi:hypothetical protein
MILRPPVFLLGDAAHVCTAGGGGPGLNLGWKLVAEIRGCASPGLPKLLPAAARRCPLSHSSQALRECVPEGQLVGLQQPGRAASEEG